ncbi:MAG: SUKH-3 domain-containing protein [Aggregatilineales bacterium]
MIAFFVQCAECLLWSGFLPSRVRYWLIIILEGNTGSSITSQHLEVYKMYQFSPVTLKLLKESGWTVDRSINIDPYKQFFKETNQPYSDTVLDFLRSFGDLTVRFPLDNNPTFIEEY